MKLKIKILLLAILPMLIVALLISFLSRHQVQSLSEQEIKTFETNFLASKRNELKNYVELALTSINPVLADTALSDAMAKTEVKRILNGLIYDSDGYFFVYDQTGKNLVHPITPTLVGQNLYDLKDPNGNYVIRSLLEMAQSGGGYHRYLWNKPSEDSIQEKMSYVVVIDRRK